MKSPTAVPPTPDLTTWLSLLWAARREADAPEWAAALVAVPGTDSVPLALHPTDDRGCLLAGASLGVAPGAVTRLAHRLLGSSGAGRRTKLTPDSAVALLAAAIDQDDDALAGLAVELDVASQRLTAIAPFLAMPLLQACHREWAADLPAAWSHGHCPVCAAWPALAELRECDPLRLLRCSRCGAGWGGAPSCPFCDCADSDRLEVRVVGAGAHAGRVEVCQECGGYVKRVRTAAAIRPGDVAMRDLLTLGLDLAALDAGFTRPAARAARPDVDVPVRRPSGLLAPLLGA